VLSIKPLGLDCAEEELRTVGVGSAVGHGQDSGAFMLQLEVFVTELLAEDALTTGTVLVGEVTSLAHELGNDSVEWRSLVTDTFLTGAESSEVFTGLGDNVITKFHNDATKRLAIGSDIEEASDGTHIGSVVLWTRGGGSLNLKRST